eukprot:CAMPEP_0184650042 /NCGR_PEP_ID=MMETSP0308-20130426/7528_1 /TAXON_ID=38269 /ORGANISM="Gloeochaete witrockiana, Strain SAG 46.84" /LENGTH=688 /DNA_ID=CAMNT_0027083269 /DNA_START=304 /DNA_END=2370 /DNA_ORIENTATION=-
MHKRSAAAEMLLAIFPRIKFDSGPAPSEQPHPCYVFQSMFSEPKDALGRYLAKVPRTHTALDIFLDGDGDTASSDNRHFALSAISHFKQRRHVLKSLSLCPANSLFKEAASASVADVIASMPLTKLVLSHRSPFVRQQSPDKKSDCLCGHEDEAVPVHVALRLLSRMSSLRHLSLTVTYLKDTPPVDNLLESLPVSLPLLTHLTILHSPSSEPSEQESPSSLSKFALLEHLKELTLDLHWPLADFRDLFLRLSKLCLNYCHPNPPNHISYDIHVVADGPFSNILSGSSFQNCHQLTSLALCNFPTSVYVARCLSLQHLNCSPSPYQTAWGLVVQDCPSLHTIRLMNQRGGALRIGGCPKLTSLTENILHIQFHDHCDSLTSLNITSPLPSQTVVRLLNMFANLTELTLGGIAGPHPLKFSALFLKRLEVGITEDTVLEFGCPLLEELCVTQCLANNEGNVPSSATCGVSGLSQSSRLHKLRLPPVVGLGTTNELRDLTALVSLDLTSFAGDFAIPTCLTDLTITRFTVPELYAGLEQPQLERLTIGTIQTRSLLERRVEILCPRLKELVVERQQGVILGLSLCFSLEVLRLDRSPPLEEVFYTLANNPMLWSMGRVGIHRLLSFDTKELARALVDLLEPLSTGRFCHLSRSQKEFVSLKLAALFGDNKISSDASARVLCDICSKYCTL